MTNADKWEEFVEWWDEEKADLVSNYTNTSYVLTIIQNKIKKLQKGEK